jgi:hypothetical protein
MDDVLLSLSDRVEARRGDPSLPRQRLSHHFTCRCGNCVYFDDTRCHACGAILGYLADEGRLVALEEQREREMWATDGRPDALKFCANQQSPAAGNWMVDADSPEQFCTSCRLTRTAMGPGFDADDVEGDVDFYGKEMLHAPDDRHALRFLHLLNGWREMTLVLNEMAQSMGEPAYYPFVISPPAVAKLQFVQMVVTDARAQA